ncbi:MAG: peptidase domain-containing ABC transporter [Promethearchaeota archaeon]
MSKYRKSAKELVDIAPPRPGGGQGGGGRGRLFAQEDIVLDHPRKDLWKWIFHHVGAFKKPIFVSLIFVSVSTILSSFLPYITRNIIDYGVIQKNYEYIFNSILVYLSLMVVTVITNYIGLYQLAKVSQQIVLSIRNEIFLHLQKCSMSYFDKRHSGEIVSISTNDVDQLNQLVGGQIVTIVSAIISIIFVLIFMYLINPFLGTLSLVVIPVYLIIVRSLRAIAGGAFRDTRKSIAAVTTSIQENIAGAKVIQSYGQEDKEKKEFDEKNFENYAARLRIRQIMALFMPLIGLISSLITIYVIMGGVLVNIGVINIPGVVVTVGDLSAFIMYLGSFFRPFMSLMQIQQIQLAALASSDRIYGLLEEKVEIPDPEKPEYFGEIVTGKLHFQNVSFGYILEDLLSDEEDFIVEIPEKEMKTIIKGIKKYPEPYKTFISQNLQNMPTKIRKPLLKSFLITRTEDIPTKIDSLLAKFHYAVTDTDQALNHPEYKTSFHSVKTHIAKIPDQINKVNKDILSKQTPESLLKMASGLENQIRKQTAFKQSSSGMETNGGSMTGSGRRKSQNPALRMIQMMTKIDIPQDIFKQFPQNVKEAIKEERKFIAHKENIGYVLENVDLKVPAGTTLAIVGETGAGKTTMIKLISRFYDIDEDGKIFLDNIEIRNVRKNDLRNLIGLVPQEAFLFNGTIKENLLYAVDEPTPALEEKMLDISKFLGLHNFIEALPEKYDTQLIENGSNVSIGQRQLIAFARALIIDPKILVLDEATSSVDPYTESLMQDALNKARKGRTTIIIAHRLSTIKNADHIIVLDKEKKGIIEQGKHENLLKLNGKYKHLLDMQHRDIPVEF